MIIGAMNHPASDPISELKWMAEMDLDFVDLTLEPPAASVQRIRPAEIRDALEDLDLEVIGHTAYYLPIASSYESVRRAAVEELKRCLEVFAAVGARWMNIHPDSHTPFQSHDFMIGRNIESLEELRPLAQELGVGLMIENLPGKFNSALQLSELLEPLAAVGLHLDIGHCNLMTEINTTEELVGAFGSRLKHVHLHDNKGGAADLHLPLGTGNLKLTQHIRTLVDAGYDGTITLEVFAPDRRYLAQSRDVLRQLWDEMTGGREFLSDKKLSTVVA